MSSRRVGGPSSPRAASAFASVSASTTGPSGASHSPEPLALDLPPRGLNVQSPLAGMIETGLSMIAQACGWVAASSPVGVQIRAMGGTAVSETPRSSETLRAEFQKLLKALRPDDTRSDYRSLASRLADLAVEVLGTNQGAKGTKKSEQEAQLVADVLALKEAFVELFQRPADSRAQGLADLRSRLGSASEALSRGQKALDASGSRAAARFRALDEMLMILSNHAQHISGEPSTAE